MRSHSAHRAIVGTATWLCTSSAALAWAQDEAPSAAAPAEAAPAASDRAPPPARPEEAKTPAPVTPEPPAQPAAPALAGAANLTAAVRAEGLKKSAEELRQRASQETGSQKQQTEALVSELLAAATQAKLEAFHPAEFAKTRDTARKLATEAELRRDAARKLAAEAAARHERARTAVAQLTREPAASKDTSSLEARAEAATLLEKREIELNAAKASATTADAAAEHASLAAKSAEESVEAADVALALMSAFTTAMERATAREPPDSEALDSAKVMKEMADEKKVTAFESWLAARKELDAYQQLLPAADAAKQSAQPKGAASDSETLVDGARLSWGITGSLLRFQTQRSANRPGRSRNFRPRYEFVPGEAGFQFLVEPAGTPWRLQLENGDSLQLMSWGGLLLASLGEDEALERGSLSLGATLAFFESAIGLGAGFDLYRGIPVGGSDGTPGGDTAFTGVLAWAFAQEGEVTAENAFVVVTVNLSSLIGALTGKEDGDDGK